MPGAPVPGVPSRLRLQLPPHRTMRNQGGYREDPMAPGSQNSLWEGWGVATGRGGGAGPLALSRPHSNVRGESPDVLCTVCRRWQARQSHTKGPRYFGRRLLRDSLLQRTQGKRGPLSPGRPESSATATRKRPFEKQRGLSAQETQLPQAPSLASREAKGPRDGRPPRMWPQDAHRAGAGLPSRQNPKHPKKARLGKRGDGPAPVSQASSVESGAPGGAEGGTPFGQETSSSRAWTLSAAPWRAACEQRPGKDINQPRDHISCSERFCKTPEKIDLSWG